MGGGGSQPGNRQDNRQRGNAAQLLEKYKSMARDSQLAGDRVQTEYYLQFADHYFRVLSESRARFEEQNPRRGRDDDDQDEDDGEEYDALDNEASDDRQEREEREERADRNERSDRGQQRRSSNSNRPRRDRDERQARDDNDDSPRNGNGGVNGGGETIPFDVLPPAIGRDEETSMDDDDDQPRPVRRRTRRPRATEGEEEIAPAA
jgi:hypothetical protein